jgi:hypothetical protein
MKEQECYDNLVHMAKTDNSNPCYGPNNQDTKGGTWQVSSDSIYIGAIDSD